MSNLDDLTKLQNRATRFAASIKSFKEYDENIRAVHQDIDDYYIEGLIRLCHEAEYITADVYDVVRYTAFSFEEEELMKKHVEAIPNDMGYTAERTKEGWLRVTLPALIHRKKITPTSRMLYWNTAEKLLKPLYQAEFEKTGEFRYQKDCVVILKHVLSPTDRATDYDNRERKVAIDVVAMFFLYGDSMKNIDLYECSGEGEDSFLTLYVVPKNEFADWLKSHKNLSEKLQKTCQKTPVF